jgi:hypothetical protein
VLAEASRADPPGLDPTDLPVGDAQAAGDDLVGLGPDGRQLGLDLLGRVGWGDDNGGAGELISR